MRATQRLTHPVFHVSPHDGRQPGAAGIAPQAALVGRDLVQDARASVPGRGTPRGETPGHGPWLAPLVDVLVFPEAHDVRHRPCQGAGDLVQRLVERHVRLRAEEDRVPRLARDYLPHHLGHRRRLARARRPLQEENVPRPHRPGHGVALVVV